MSVALFFIAGFLAFAACCVINAIDQPLDPISRSTGVATVVIFAAMVTIITVAGMRML